MLKVEKVFDIETGVSKNSKTFNAQWYPKVKAQIKRTGGTTHTVKLQGKVSLDADWEDIYEYQNPQNGKRVIKTIVATAGNVVTNLSPPAGKRWLVLHGKIILGTDATVANRMIEMLTTDGTNETQDIAASNAVIAANTGHFDFGQGRTIDDGKLGSAAGAHTHTYVGIDAVLLEGDDQLRFTILNGVAGDSYSGYVVVVETRVNAGKDVTLLKASADWYHYFRIVLSGNDGTINAWIGAGGA